MKMIKHKHQSFLVELSVRLALFVVYWITDDAVPFQRKIQPEEMWLYRYPKTPSYYPGYLLWLTVLATPVVVMGLFYLVRRSAEDLVQGLLAVFLSIFLTGSLTNLVKLGVGRPRPDYIDRCFPDGAVREDMACTGNMDTIIEGRKSFPSGHSSCRSIAHLFAFACLAFISLYVAGKFHVFSSKGRGNGLKLCCVVIPLLWATLIAVSRTADYHHHWQDVTVGSLEGLLIAYIVYRQYYPPLSRPNCHLPYTEIPAVLDVHTDLSDSLPQNGDPKAERSVLSI
ncbi:phospholipid phosphatase 5-like isoform X2 [Haliotis rubra]|uniref:phospholipid phosphatase 5-like isoform X2 n=1 Tax=Haliotis rubra TaxID=36100 RepID=UPI001EE629B0|nr:phospholipid phosphatase 5-like isoform X2 [Haliotis rubra]